MRCDCQELCVPNSVISALPNHGLGMQSLDTMAADLETRCEPFWLECRLTSVDVVLSSSPFRELWVFGGEGTFCRVAARWVPGSGLAIAIARARPPHGLLYWPAGTAPRFGNGSPHGGAFKLTAPEHRHSICQFSALSWGTSQVHEHSDREKGPHGEPNRRACCSVHRQPWSSCVSRTKSSLVLNRGERKSSLPMPEEFVRFAVRAALVT